MAWLTSGGIRGISTYLVFENKFAYNVNAISLFRTSPAVYRHKEEAMTEAVVAKQTGIELVLNGGKREMDSPTIPVTWVFDDDTIANKPAAVDLARIPPAREGDDAKWRYPPFLFGVI